MVTHYTYMRRLIKEEKENTMEKKEQLIIVLSGKKQSGKTTISNFIVGTYLLETKRIKNFHITDEGSLGAIRTSGEGIVVPDGEFNKIFPDEDVKIYQFADELKLFCINVLGLTHDQCYGSDEEKNSLVRTCRWGGIPHTITERYGKAGDEAMTAREVMQVFGTDMVRAMCPNAWADATYRRVLQEKKEVSDIV